MSRFGIVNLIDKLFITFATFLIVYAWLNFYIRDLNTTFFLSIIFALAFTYVLFYILNKLQNKKHITTNKMKEIEKNFLAFRLMSLKEKLNFLQKILSKSYDTKLLKNILSYTKDNQNFSLIIATQKSVISQEDLINLIEEHNIKTNNLIIICQDYLSNINNKLIRNLNIEFVNKEKLFTEYFEPNNIYPDCSILNEKSLKPNFKSVAKNFLKKEKSKQYFWLGFVLIFSSFILPFKIYYLIFGSAFIICCILCKIIPLVKNSNLF